MDYQKIKTSSYFIYCENALKLYRLFKDFKNIHKNVSYYRENKIILEGKNWLLKDMVIEAQKIKYATRSIIIFKPNLLSFVGIQLEGKFPGMEWQLQVVPLGHKKSKVISSHSIPAKNFSRVRYQDTKRKLKSIEQKLLLDMSRKIESQL